MNVRDHTLRRRPPRVRWFLTAGLSFTAGVIAAATLFAYTSRIPIPLKVTPTRETTNLLDRPGDDGGDGELQFQERLLVRDIQPTEAPAAAQAPAPNLPDSTATLAAPVQPQPVSAAPQNLPFFVQAGQFADAAAAARLVTELEGMSLPASVREVAESTDNKLYRVLIGPYSQASEAEAAKARLALIGRATTLLRLPGDG